MSPGESQQVRPLLNQLGYTLEPVEVERRFRAVVEAPAHGLFVAEQDGQMIGFIHLYARPALDKPPEAIVQALVVHEAARGNGLGRKLMEAAEQWAEARQSASVALSSDIVRAAVQRGTQTMIHTHGALELFTEMLCAHAHLHRRFR